MCECVFAFIPQVQGSVAGCDTHDEYTAKLAFILLTKQMVKLQTSVV